MLLFCPLIAALPQNLLAAEPMRLDTIELRNGLVILIQQDDHARRLEASLSIRTHGPYFPPELRGLSPFIHKLAFTGGNRLGVKDSARNAEYLDAYALALETLRQKKADKRAIYARLDSLKTLLDSIYDPGESRRLIEYTGAREIGGDWGRDQLYWDFRLIPEQIEPWFEWLAYQIQSPAFSAFPDVWRALQSEYAAANSETKLRDALLPFCFPEEDTPGEWPAGFQDSLARPSLVAAREAWSFFFAPNRMTLCFTGPADAELIEKLAVQWFGDLKKDQRRSSGEYLPQEKPDAPSSAVQNQRPPHFRMALAAPNPYAESFQLFSATLKQLTNRGKCGLWDDMIWAEQLDSIAVDYAPFSYGSLCNIRFYPARGSISRKKLKAEIEAGIDALSDYYVEPRMIAGAKKNLEYEFYQTINRSRARNLALKDLAVYRRPWKKYVKMADYIEAIDSAKITQSADTWFREKYALVWMKQGEPRAPEFPYAPKRREKELQLPAPDDNINALFNYFHQAIKRPLEPSDTSEFAAAFYAKYPPPYFATYALRDSQYYQGNFGLNQKYYYTHNPNVPVFETTVEFEAGENLFPDLPRVIDYLAHTGTYRLPYKNYTRELYLLGGHIRFASDAHYFSAHISGPESSLRRLLKLVSDKIERPEMNAAIAQYRVQALREQRQSSLLRPECASRYVWARALHKQASPFLKRADLSKMNEADPNAYLDTLRKIRDYAATTYHYGGRQLEDAFIDLRERLKLPARSRKLPKLPTRPVAYYKKPVVYVYNIPKQQRAEVMACVTGAKVTARLLYWNNLLDYCWNDPENGFLPEYFGAGAGGIYEAAGWYAARELLGLRGFARIGVSCAPERAEYALAGAHRLLQSYAADPARLEAAAQRLKTDMLLNFHYREPFMDAYYAERWRLAGYKKEPADFHRFAPPETDTAYFNLQYAKHVANHPRAYAVIGDVGKMDLQALSRFGKIVELKAEDLLAQ